MSDVQPGALIAGKDLYEVVAPFGSGLYTTCRLVRERDGSGITSTWTSMKGWVLVREAPVVPDYLPVEVAAS